jgi:hypothetical protein
VDPTRVPVGIDHSTFFTPQIPETVHAAVPLLHALSAADQAVVVSAALALYLSLEQEQGGEGQGPILRPDALRHVADSDYGRPNILPPQHVVCLFVSNIFVHTYPLLYSRGAEWRL